MVIGISNRTTVEAARKVITEKLSAAELNFPFYVTITDRRCYYGFPIVIMPNGEEWTSYYFEMNK